MIQSLFDGRVLILTRDKGPHAAGFEGTGASKSEISKARLIIIDGLMVKSAYGGFPECPAGNCNPAEDYQPEV